MNKKILKETRSVCPVCIREIEAKVIEENGKVYMIKECEKHGRFKGIVEKDVEFYKKTMNKYVKNDEKSFTKLMLTYTHKCNLNCNFCWLPQKNRKDFSTIYLKKLIQESNYNAIRISGGEPTTQYNLPYLIRFIKKMKKEAILLTNGLKLNDLNYVKKLKNAGLDIVVFSFNSFNDDTYKKLNGKKLLNIKLKALEKLEKVGIKVALSVMIVKGINDNELKRIFDYCIENNSFIKELRIRSSSQLGKHHELGGFFVSDMIKIFSKILKINKNDFMKIINKNRHIPCSINCILIFSRDDTYINSWKLTDILPAPNCMSSYDKRFTLVDKAVFVYKILLKFKINTFFKLVMNKINGRNDLKILRLQLKSWPNKYNVDLEEMKMCSTHMVSTNRRSFPFCYALILNDENVIEL